jgi:hypothetical protein
MTLAQMIARLTRGYIKETGRQPVGLDKLRIKMEAAEKLRQMNKIIQFPQQRSFKKEIEDMIEDGTIKMGGVTKQSDKVRTRNMFKDSNLNKPKAVKTEAELKAEIEAGNKKSIQNLKDKLDNPEDMADGGVAGLLGERPGYADGLTVEEQLNKLRKQKGLAEDPLTSGSLIPDLSDPRVMSDIAVQTGLPTTTQKFDTGGYFKTKLDYPTAQDASTIKSIQNFKRGIPDPTTGIRGLDRFTAPEISDFMGVEGLYRGLNPEQVQSIYDKVEKDDDDQYADIEGQTAFVGLPEIFALGKTLIGPVISGGSVSAAAKKALENKIKREMTKKAYKYLEKKITKPKYGTTSPTTKTTGGGRFDPSGPTQASIRASRGDKSGRGSRGGFTNPGKGSYGPHMALGGLASFADGGPARQNFAMGRRAFLKMLAGTGAGIAGLKSGLIGMGGKEATKKAVTETVKSAGSSTPPPYFFRLVEKIKFMGDDTLATQDKAIAKKYKDYVMEEDFAGNIEIIKKGADDMYPEDVYMSYKVDEVPTKIGKKRSAKVEEYEEFTARPDGDGKMKNIEPGVPDEVIDEAGDTTAMTLKKSSGGIARMLGE